MSLLLYIYSQVIIKGKKKKKKREKETKKKKKRKLIMLTVLMTNDNNKGKTNLSVRTKAVLMAEYNSNRKDDIK